MLLLLTNTVLKDKKDGMYRNAFSTNIEKNPHKLLKIKKYILNN